MYRFCREIQNLLKSFRGPTFPRSSKRLSVSVGDWAPERETTFRPVRLSQGRAGLEGVDKWRELPLGSEFWGRVGSRRSKEPKQHSVAGIGDVFRIGTVVG